jgi:hypothetical protein
MSILRISLLLTVVLFVATGIARAQNAGPLEAFSPNGAADQSVSLTPAQRGAISNAVFGDRVRAATTTIPVTVGAAVPPLVELRDLPDQSETIDSATGFLKYAVVENNIVIVDPISMRVVDVIYGNAEP